MSVVKLNPIVYVNGKCFTLPAGRGEATLLQFLRGTGSYGRWLRIL